MILRHDFVFPLDCFVVNVNLGAEGQTTKEQLRGVPAGLVVRIPGFHCHGAGSSSGWKTEIPQESKVTISTYGNIYRKHILLKEIYSYIRYKTRQQTLLKHR